MKAEFDDRGEIVILCETQAEVALLRSKFGCGARVSAGPSYGMRDGVPTSWMILSPHEEVPKPEPLTTEQAEREFAEAPDEPLSLDEIERIVRRVVDPKPAPLPHEWENGYGAKCKHCGAYGLVTDKGLCPARNEPQAAIIGAYDKRAEEQELERQSKKIFDALTKPAEMAEAPPRFSGRGD